MTTAHTGRVVQQPSIPSSFYGMVLKNNANVPVGTTIEVVIEGQVVADSKSLLYEGNSVYTIDVPGNDPGTGHIDGGRPGDTLVFLVNGLEAHETAIWQSGTNIEHNLTILTPATQIPTTSPRLPNQTAVNPSETIMIEENRLQTPVSQATTTPAGFATITALPVENNTRTKTVIPTLNKETPVENNQLIQTEPTNTLQLPRSDQKPGDKSETDLAINEGIRAWPWFVSAGILICVLFGVFRMLFRK